LIGLAAAACIGAVNGIVTLRFAIPSFITTLGMLFVARSITVVISGGFPPLLPPDVPAHVFTQFVGLIRLSMFWFAGIAAGLGALVGALLIRVIDNGLVRSHVDANWFKFAIGSLLILAVVGNSWLRRTSRRIKLEL